MRRTRRGGGSALEFGGSGEDSFVAVVVTKLTGALLFILLLTMVIMALLPKAADLDASGRDAAASDSPGRREPLRIATPGTLPDAVAGRPYLVALAATGGHARPRWWAEGSLPAWLALDEATGRLAGTPSQPTAEPLSLRLCAGDGTEVTGQAIQLAVLPSPTAPVAGAWWRPQWPAVAWRAWLEQGVGFLVLWLVHLLGMNLLSSMERHSLAERVPVDGLQTGQIAVQRRFLSYRVLVRLATLSAMTALVAWLVLARNRTM
jgi:putative Ig domain-containing protein